MNPPRQIFIRPYAADDLDAVMAVFVSAVREVASQDYHAAQIQAWAQIDRDPWAANRLSRPTWVAVLENKIIGFSDLKPDGHLDMLYVHPAYQGIGTATTLVKYIESYARDKNMTHLFTESSLTAQGFFERRGFHSLVKQIVDYRGQQFTNIRMEKKL